MRNSQPLRMTAQEASVNPKSRSVEWTAGALASSMPVLHRTDVCSKVYDWFADNTEPAAAIVDDDGRVLGIVNRLRFFARYAKRYFPELYGKRSIVQLANANPLIVDENMPVSELAATLVLEWPDALRECFVVTRQGRYLGIGTSESLVRCKVAILTAREEELKSALLSATDANQTKSHFLALMSHELRTPLNAIIGFSEVLFQELFGPLGGERYREYAKDIHGAGRHLLAIINDILDLSKAEAGKLDLSFEAIDVPALLDDCVRMVVSRARDQGIIIDIKARNDLPAFHADSLRIKQVLLNLLSNAIKFTPKGGRVLVEADLGLNGGFVFTVSDTGIGMAPETIPMALQPFRRISSPYASNVEGTGLGLSLIKSLTEQHAGDLAIESALNKGTVVRLTFPPERTL